MKKLSQLLESVNEIDSLLEIDFKDKESFQKYQAKHKMRPTTKVNIAGKDTTVGDETGDKPKSEKPKSDKPKPIKLNSYAKKALSDIETDFEPYVGLSELIRRPDSTIRNKVVGHIKSTENFNGYIRRLYSELEESGVSQEDLSTLEGLEVDSDNIINLSDVPEDELVSKVKQLGKLVGRLGGVKNENFDLRQLSKITTRYTNRLDENIDMKKHKKEIDKLMRGSEWGNEVYDYIDIDIEDGRKTGFDILGSKGKKLKQMLDTAMSYESGVYTGMSEREYNDLNRKVQIELNRVFK